jgi:hypothetical protein
LGILIPRQLTQEQYIKLFSNPVSGIACEVDAYNRDHRVKYHCKNIRYSKSMIVKALDFWFDQLHAYFMKVWYIRHPMMDVSQHIIPELKRLGEIMCMIKDHCPDTFLFSHRYISSISIQPTKYSTGMREQSKLLSNKYEDIFFFQEGSLQPYKPIKTNVGIEFTVFPNEHPYITRQKISRVGMTEKGNVFVMMSKDGAQKK